MPTLCKQNIEIPSNAAHPNVPVVLNLPLGILPDQKIGLELP